ncbi:hypothetical protein [Paracoccus luteus]|uniref:hypothetical protein n=1 Tax=Paracoccus luteus TaxID=2508543 RepID=UPI0010702738|nr:hypothetical protein [Paracoccus luteus]
MRIIEGLGTAVLLGLAAVPFAAQPARAAPLQVFSLTATGPSAIPGRSDLRLRGIAFAVSRDTLLTAPLAIGVAADFAQNPQFGRDGVPARAIQLDALGPGEQPTLSAQARPFAGRVAVLDRGAQQPALTPMPLSACAVQDADHVVQAAGGAAVTVTPVRDGGVVTHFDVAQPAGGWDARASLGAPVLRDGRVIGVVTDATADGRSVEVTPIAAVADLLPEDAEVDCDPRVSVGALDDMRSDMQDIARRLSGLDSDIRAQTSRVEAAEQTAQLAMSALADVAGDLSDLQTALTSGTDIEPILNRMSLRLQRKLPLVNAVSTIEDYLQRPTWKARAKSDGGELQLTFSYRTQLPGPQFSDRLRLCMRVINPVQSSDDQQHYFRARPFYAAAAQQDEAGLVRCERVNVASSAVLTDSGEYRFEVWRSDLAGMFDDYREDRDWIPRGYEWSGLFYAALVRPAPGGTGPAGPAGSADEQGDQVILRVLVKFPDRQGGDGGVVPVQCMLFDSDQSVIDFLAQRAPRSDSMGFDDVSGLDLDPQNTSDECVLASAQ